MRFAAQRPSEPGQGDYSRQACAFSSLVRHGEGAKQLTKSLTSVDSGSNLLPLFRPSLRDALKGERRFATFGACLRFAKSPRARRASQLPPIVEDRNGGRTCSL